jgi:hypothetical protein
MNPLVRQNALSTSWLLQALMAALPQKEEEVTNEELDEAQEGISQSTLKEWKDRGLISYQERNRPDVHQAAVLLIARQVDQRVRNWLPTRMTPDEARSWCWRQDTPHLAPVPCPLPFSDNLGKATLLMTTWPGRAWDPHWRQISSIGAARWAGVTEQERWDVTLEDLRLWDPQVAALHVPLMGRVEDILQELADIALIRLAFIQFDAQSNVLEQV